MKIWKVLFFEKASLHIQKKTLKVFAASLPKKHHVKKFNRRSNLLLTVVTRQKKVVVCEFKQEIGHIDRANSQRILLENGIVADGKKPTVPNKV